MRRVLFPSYTHTRRRHHRRRVNATRPVTGYGYLRATKWIPRTAVPVVVTVTLLRLRRTCAPGCSTSSRPRPFVSNEQTVARAGTGSVGRVFERHGYAVTTLDLERRFNPDIVADILTWDYRAAFPPGHFEVISLGVPCTEFSIALTTRPRDLDLANRIVKRSLEIVEYFRPTRWFMENPRTGLLGKQDYVQNLAHVDVDYCQFTEPTKGSDGQYEWGYRKPTRFWGSPDLAALPDRLCDGRTCRNLRPITEQPRFAGQRRGGLRHLVLLGATAGRTQRTSRNKRYRVPEGVVEYVGQLGGGRTGNAIPGDVRPPPLVPVPGPAEADNDDAVAGDTR